MSNDASQLEYDGAGKVTFHPSCVADPNQPTFDHEWQRRAFGLAVALSEFGHYSWVDFQSELIASIGAWEDSPDSARARWDYYQRWLEALESVIESQGLLRDDYVNREDR